MWFSLFYELGVFVCFLLFLPKALYQAIRYKKYRKSFLQRLSWGFPKVIRKEDGPIIWVHAVSVGETQAIAALVKEIKEQTKNAQILVSSVTETGHAEAKRSIPFADFHVFLPFDFFFIVKYVFKM